MEKIRSCKDNRGRTPLVKSLLSDQNACDNPTPEAWLGVIEFNDRGEYNKIQRDQAFDLIYDVTQATDAIRPLVVVFAHGWHHNAAVCDTNLACFRKVLVGLADQRTSRDPESSPSRHPSVIGIYLGWRGESDSGKLNYPTLFSRKTIAQRIGRRGGLEVLRDLDNYSKLNGFPLVVVGHSLGGALVFTAIQNSLQANLPKDLLSTEYERVSKPVALEPDFTRRGFGDLVVLVNPAVEAYEYEAFAADNRPAAGRPELVVVASDHDKAMQIPFTGSRLAQLFWRPSHVLRGKSNLLGLGHLDSQVTHTLRWVDGVPEKLSQPADRKRIGGSCGCNYAADGKEVERRGRMELALKEGRRRTEFAVIRTDDTVINGHNDIYNARFVRFLTRSVLDNCLFVRLDKENVCTMSDWDQLCFDSRTIKEKCGS